MMRSVVCAFALFAALLFGSAGAVENAPPEKVSAKPAKRECKKIKGKCVKQAVKKLKPKAKKKPKPLTPVTPSIEKGYRPPLFTTSPRMQFAVIAYKQCMYGDVPPGVDTLERALLLNLSYRDSTNLGGSAEKLGREVCLADALGLERYATQADIDRAKGVTLFEVSPQFIDFPDDEGNRLPAERRFARLWVKEYVEQLANDLHAHLLALQPKGAVADIPLLRVNSLVRSLVNQSEQHSPAKCKNEICSTHLTGGTIDIANGDLRVSKEARKWIRERLIRDRKDGKIIMIQEFTRPHYHVFVIPPEYVEWYKENPPEGKSSSVR